MNMNKIIIKNILKEIQNWKIPFKFIGNEDGIVLRPASIYDIEDYDLSFYRNFDFKEHYNKVNSNNLIILHHDVYSSELPKSNYIFVDDPSLCFNIVGWLFKKKTKSIHESAQISKSALIGKNVHVGANTIINDKVEVGNNTYIAENCVISNSIIGKDVSIQPGVKIGSMGLGSYMHPNGKWVDFPHFGNVIIENNVVIQDNTVINRGSLNDTTIKKYSRIGPLCCIAHGVSIGESCFISQASTIAGSVKIGSKSTIWGNSSIRDGVTIGKNCVIGLGAVVVKNVPDKQLWVGNPARFMKKISL